MSATGATKKRRRPWTLRARLTLALLVLLATGLTAFGFISVTALQSSLVDSVDDQLNGVVTMMSAPDRPPPRPPQQINVRDRLPTDYRVLFYDRTGRLTERVGQAKGETLMPVVPPMDVASVRARGPGAFTVGDEVGGTTWRVRTAVQAPTPAQPVSGTVAVAESLDSGIATANRLKTIELGFGFGLVVLLGVIATWLIRLGLRPLTRIEHTAQAIAGGEFDRRVPDLDPRTEAGRLGSAFNVMLGQVASALKKREQSEDRLRRFVADASHELRTPLTSIRGFAELYRKRDGSSEVDVQRMMSRIENGAIQMGLLVDDLLLLARLDQERVFDLSEVDLSALAADVVHDARAREPARVIGFAAAAEPVRVLGDVHRLRQVAANLVTNALVHTPPDAEITVSVWLEPADPGSWPVVVGTGDPPAGRDWAVLEVRDDGPGVAPDGASRIFDRFSRAGPARTKAGAGLGLAIAAAILDAHGGSAVLLDTPGGGATFRVLLGPA
ncbi:HAMP domain-containing sensor histidine kinase [Amycolatopsis sp. PS_44_ISF1]|uniref:sensor histidine kinase n=1 Tax=Amycolatopsis sp. PS_44_ISF1 TaxID=2974917 RepID=UPI0028E09045|nr:HAMP domain-containing sensor histidine kinase [Amycolatopsis sp. PS_44_ISF1]MDT8913212.1 HAMP domain-containing histidine kinase [Amycolatopsis sp. PS_44_ISF1]